MKKIACSVLVLSLIMGCNRSAQKPLEPVVDPRQTENVKEKTFDELFKSITPAEIPESMFKLIGQDYTVITAGTETDYNSMTASWGGWGILFNEPVTWGMLRANRYTLEYIKRTKTYTMSYFDEPFKDQVMLFGSSSGRDSDKMKRHTLTAVTTPLGNISYKESKLIIECELIALNTVQPDDFYTPEGKTFITDAFREVKAYHKLVFGKITGVRIRK
jgi:flavin reductase (DIM6/NTAB) family NADH-FMN oxidoreductase RutF